MVLEILKQFNWVDVVIVFLLLRISYVSVKNGFVVELFKFLGTVFSIYAAFHYFTIISDRIIRHVPEEQSFPVEFMDFLTCVGLVVVVYLFFVFLRNIVCHFIKMEAVPALTYRHEGEIHISNESQRRKRMWHSDNRFDISGFGKVS